MFLSGQTPCDYSDLARGPVHSHLCKLLGEPTVLQEIVLSLRLSFIQLILIVHGKPTAFLFNWLAQSFLLNLAEITWCLRKFVEGRWRNCAGKQSRSDRIRRIRLSDFEVSVALLRFFIWFRGRDSISSLIIPLGFERVRFIYSFRSDSG